MTSLVCFQNNSSAQGNPGLSSGIGASDPRYYHNYLQAKWKDNTHVTYGGSGVGGAINANFMYDGTFTSDTTDWTISSSLADLRNVAGTVPFTLAPNQSVDYDYAFVFNRDTIASDYNGLFSASSNIADYKRVARWFNNNSFPSCLEINAGINEVNKTLKTK